MLTPRSYSRASKAALALLLLGVVACAETEPEAGPGTDGGTGNTAEGTLPTDASAGFTPTSAPGSSSATGSASAATTSKPVAGSGTTGSTAKPTGSTSTTTTGTVDAGTLTVDLDGLFADGGALSGLGGSASGGASPSADGGAAPLKLSPDDPMCKDSACFDVFDCYIFHIQKIDCGFTACDGFICK